MFVSQKHLLVEWGHCDPAGIVFYPQYLAWFDDCTTALFANAGMPTRALFKSHGIIGVPLVDVRVRFLMPSTFGDELLAESTVTEFRNSSFVHSASSSSRQARWRWRDLKRACGPGRIRRIRSA